MAYSGPYVAVAMVNGRTYNLPGTIGEVTQLLQKGGPLLAVEDVFGNEVLLNTEHVVNADEMPASEFE